MTWKRSGTLACLGVVAVLMLGLGLAWACTPTSSIVLLPETGPTASKITVSGQVAPDAGSAAPVEIRWNSVSGLLLGTVTADATRNFSAEVTVPDVAPGVYYVLAISGKAEAGRASYEVATSSASVSTAQRAAPSKSVSADLWTGLAKQDGAISAAVPSNDSRSEAPEGTAAAGFALLAIGFVGLAGHLLLRARMVSKARLR